MTCLVPGFPRQARTDQRESADRIDPALAAEAIESTEAREPTEPIDKIEPAEPIDKMDPAEPIDKIDPLEPIDKIDPLEPMLRMDPSLFRMGFILAGTKAIKVGNRDSGKARQSVIGVAKGGRREARGPVGHHQLTSAGYLGPQAAA